MEKGEARRRAAEKCPECSSTNILRGFEIGKTICGTCGFVLQEQKKALHTQIAVEMPVNTALGIFSETGDLPVGKYPALEELAGIIAQVLDVGDETRSFASMEEVEDNGIIVSNEKVDFDPLIPKDKSRTWLTKDQARGLKEIKDIFEKPPAAPIEKPTIDIMHLSNSVIIRVRCPKCRTLNAKDTRRCRECDYRFYKDDNEYYKSLDSIEKLEVKEESRARACKVRDNMIYEKKGRGRLFRRKDGKYLIYIPKDLAEDSTFPLRGSSSTLVKIRIAREGDKLIIEQCKERKKDFDRGARTRALEKMFQRKD